MANNVVGVPHPNGSYSYAAGDNAQRGPAPTAAQPKGTQFYDTQDNALYVSNGAAWVPAGGGGGTSSTLTLDPAGTVGNGVYLDWQTLWTAYLATNGAVVIAVLSAATVPAGTYKLRLGTIFQGVVGLDYKLQLLEGAVLENLLTVISLNIEGLGAVTHALTWPDVAVPTLLLQAGTQLIGTGAAAMIRWEEDAAVRYLVIALDRVASLRRNTAGVVEILGAGHVAGAQVIFFVGAYGSTIDTNVVSSDLTGKATVIAQDVTGHVGAQPNYLAGVGDFSPTVDGVLPLDLSQTLHVGGGVGIATPVNPLYDLDVAGDVHIGGKLNVDGLIDPTGVLLTGADKRFGATDAGPVYLAPFADAVAGVQVRRADNATTVLGVDTLNQRVGVGTATPSATLHVVGTLRATALGLGLLGADASGNVTSGGGASAGGQRITAVGAPVLGTDAARLLDAQTAAAGLSVKAPATASTTAPLPAYMAVGNVLTKIGSGALPAQDGVVLAATDTLFVPFEVFPNDQYNGIYDVTDAGSGITPWVLTRRADVDTDAEMVTGVYALVLQGTLYGGTGWVLQTPAPIVLNITPLVFVQFNAPGVTLAGNGLNKVVDTFSVVPNADGSVVVGATVGVGVLASDAQHGVRGGGTQHALVTPNPGGVAGFMSPADKTTLDGLSAGTVGGSGTPLSLALWIAPSTLTDSGVTDDGLTLTIDRDADVTAGHTLTADSLGRHAGNQLTVPAGSAADTLALVATAQTLQNKTLRDTLIDPAGTFDCQLTEVTALGAPTKPDSAARLQDCGTGNVTTLGLSVGTLPKADAADNLVDSLVTDDGVTVTVTAAAHVAGALTVDTDVTTPTITAPTGTPITVPITVGPETFVVGSDLASFVSTAGLSAGRMPKADGATNLVDSLASDDGASTVLGGGLTLTTFVGPGTLAVSAAGVVSVGPRALGILLKFAGTFTAPLVPTTGFLVDAPLRGDVSLLNFSAIPPGYPVSVACTARDLYVNVFLSTMPLGVDVVFTLLKNGVATALTVTLPGGTAGGVFADVADTVVFAATDTLDLQMASGAGGVGLGVYCSATLRLV